MNFDKLFEEVMSGQSSTENYIDMIKSMPTDQLTGLFREDLHIYYERIKGTASEGDAQDRIADMGNELLSRGLTSEELAAIRDEAEQASAVKHQEEDEYEHKGWPGDGSGEDDFADYNQMEGNDY